jgi:hypothetical protein
MPVLAYEVGPRRDHRGVNLIADALPFGRLGYAEPNAIENAIDYANHRSPGVYDENLSLYSAQFLPKQQLSP